MRSYILLLNGILAQSACDDHKCTMVYIDDGHIEEPGECIEDSSKALGYRCKCEEIDPTFLLTQDIYCYALNSNGRIYDTTTPKPEPRTTTVTTRTTIGRIESTEYLSTTVAPSLQPPEEITDDVTSTDSPSITDAPTMPVVTTRETTTEKEKTLRILGMEAVIFFIFIGGCGLFLIIIIVVSIIYCRCPSKKKETPARNDTQRNALLPDIDEEIIPEDNRNDDHWRNSQDSFDNTDDEWGQDDPATPTEAIKLCKYAPDPAKPSSVPSQNGGSRPISTSLHSISSNRPSVKPPAPPVPDPSALLNAPPDFPPPPPPPALEGSGNLIANPKYPYHVPIANQQQNH